MSPWVKRETEWNFKCSSGFSFDIVLSLLIFLRSYAFLCMRSPFWQAVSIPQLTRLARNSGYQWGSQFRLPSLQSCFFTGLLAPSAAAFFMRYDCRTNRLCALASISLSISRNIPLPHNYLVVHTPSSVSMDDLFSASVSIRTKNYVTTPHGFKLYRPSLRLPRGHEYRRRNMELRFSSILVGSGAVPGHCPRPALPCLSSSPLGNNSPQKKRHLKKCQPKHGVRLPT